MIKVAVNSLLLGSGHQYRGIGFYINNLLPALRKIPGLEIEEFSDISRVKDADVVHFPFFDLFQKTLPIRKKIPTVITIHDITPILFPKAYPPGIKGTLKHFYQKLALKNVKAVITDSISSQKDIISYFGIPDERVYPIYLAPSGHFHRIEDKSTLTIIRQKYQLPEVFALYFGSINWNKNLLNMTEGCLKADLDIVLIGKDFEVREDLDHPEKVSFKKFLEQFGNNPRVHILGFLGNEDLVAVANLAKVVLLPSFYEGFGLPILEAQICGTPVITSNISSMPEVAGKGALFVDPKNAEEITGAVKSIMENSDLRKQLIRSGEENIKKFSWDKAAEETYEVYKKAIQE